MKESGETKQVPIEDIGVFILDHSQITTYCATGVNCQRLSKAKADSIGIYKNERGKRRQYVFPKE